MCDFFGRLYPGRDNPYVSRSYLTLKIYFLFSAVKDSVLLALVGVLTAMAQSDYNASDPQQFSAKAQDFIVALLILSWVVNPLQILYLLVNGCRQAYEDSCRGAPLVHRMLNVAMDACSLSMMSYAFVHRETQPAKVLNALYASLALTTAHLLWVATGRYQLSSLADTPQPADKMVCRA